MRFSTLLRGRNPSVLILAVALSWAVPAYSQGLSRWTFEGITTESEVFPQWVGRTYSFSFMIDTSRLTEVQPGAYYPVMAYIFQLPDPNVAYGGAVIGSGILVVNDGPAVGGGSLDGVYIGVEAEAHDGFPANVKLDGYDIGVTLLRGSTEPTSPPFTSTHFPATLNLNDFDARYMTSGWGGLRGSVDRFYIDGALISQVPEPHSATLWWAGALLLGGWPILRRRAISRGQE